MKLILTKKLPFTSKRLHIFIANTWRNRKWYEFYFDCYSYFDCYCLNLRQIHIEISENVWRL